MTFKYRETLLNILETLYTANSYFCEITESEIFIEFCGECQKVAFDIGTRIEKYRKKS